MGSGHSVELTADADSPTEPGKKSILSASLDDLEPPVTGQRFFEELMAMVRRVDPITENVLKSIDVQEETPTKFTVKIILDGAKLDSYGYGKGDGTDRVKSWKKVSVDMAALEAVVEDFVPEMLAGAWIDEASDKEVVFTSHLKIVKDPTRLEVYCVDQQGERLSSEALRDGLYGALDPIIFEIQAQAQAKVQLTPNAPAMKDEGQVSAVSGPMDEHVYYDGFFDSMLAIIREDMSTVPGAELQEVGEGEFVAVQPVKDKDGNDKTIQHRVTFSQATGEIAIQFKDGDKVMRQQFHVVHQTPLVIEAWMVGPDGARTAAPSATRFLQKQVNRAIEKANSWFG